MKKIGYIFLMLVICVAGALLNYYINLFFCVKLDIPLYLDTIMTIAITFFAGPVWGCLTGALSNIFGTIIGVNVSYWEGYLFGLCNIAAALTIWFFIRIFRREIYLGYKQDTTAEIFIKPSRLGIIIDRIIVLTIVSFALCLVISIIGGIIAAIINLDTELAPINLFSQKMPLILSQILSRIPVNIVDRLISVFAGWGIAYAVVRFTALQPFKLNP